METEKAGVKKNVTFHTARHSCAVLLLTLGADIYTVSKILGHRSVRATQVYAKIVDKKKDDAIALLSLIHICIIHAAKSGTRFRHFSATILAAIK